MKSQFRMYDFVPPLFFSSGGGVQLTANAQVVLQRGSEYHWNCGLGYFSSDEDLWLDLHATDACETWLVYVNCWPVCPNSEWLVVSWDIGQLYPPNKSVWSLSSQRGCKLAIDIFSFQSIQHYRLDSLWGAYPHISTQPKIHRSQTQLAAKPFLFFSKWQDWCCGDLGDGAFGSRDLR